MIIMVKDHCLLAMDVRVIIWQSSLLHWILQASKWMKNKKKGKA